MEQQEAGHDVWILLCKDQCCCSQLLHTASALITKSSGISSCFQGDVFVFYVFGSSSSSWDICVLPVSRPSRVCVVNTSTRSLWILWTFTGSILTWTHPETLLGGWKEKFQKMSRTTWLRLQVWKQRKWCLVKVLYFHTWTQINSQLSFILYPGWISAVCQRSAVLLWLQLWGQTPLISENWIWVETTCRTQQWRSCVVFYRVQPVDWRLWGQFTDFCRSHIYKTAFIHNWSHLIII